MRAYIAYHAMEMKKLIFGKKSRYLLSQLSDIQCDIKTQQKIVAWLKNPKNFLVLYGKPGKGKTHFCSGAIEFIMRKVGVNFRYFRETDFLEKLRNYVAEGRNYSSELKYLLDNDFFIFDDIGSTGDSNTDWRQEVMFSSIDTLYTRDIPAIITSNMNQHEMKNFYGERFASRVFAKENLVICVDSWPDFREMGY